MTEFALILTVDTGLRTCGWALTYAETGNVEAWDQTTSDTKAKFAVRCKEHARQIIKAVEAVLAETGATLHSIHLERSGEGAPNAKRRGVLLVNAVTMELWHHLGEHWDWAFTLRPVHEKERGVRGKSEAEIVWEAHYHLVEEGSRWCPSDTGLLKGDGSPNKSKQHGADAILLGRAVRRRLELLEAAKRT